MIYTGLTALDRVNWIRSKPLQCPVCKRPLRNDKKRLRQRCSHCSLDFRLTAGTLANGSKLDTDTWLAAAETFAGERRGISTRDLSGQINVSVETAHRITTIFRRSLMLADYPVQSSSRIVFEIALAGQKGFFINPPEQVHSRADWRLLIVCGVEMSGAHLNRITSLVAQRLENDGADTLAAALKLATSNAKNIYCFNLGRCRSDNFSRLDLNSFLDEKDRAGGELKTRLKDLEHLLLTVPQGSIKGPSADGHIAEFNFRHSLRTNQTRDIANKLLELVFEPIDLKTSSDGPIKGDKRQRRATDAEERIKPT